MHKSAENESPASPKGHNYGDISAYDQSSVHVGDVINISAGPEPEAQLKPLGFCLGRAPRISQNHFVGRNGELDQMSEILEPGSESVKLQQLVLGGLGGIGKTQLAIAYAHRYRESYDSIVWLNATSESTLKRGFHSLAGKILGVTEAETLTTAEAYAETVEWLRDARNTKWLLIFDNYDNPDEFDVREYFDTAHGSVIITTRYPDLVSGEAIRIQHLDNVEESLDILQVRSERRDVKNGKYLR